MLHRALSFQFKCTARLPLRSITRNNMQIAGWRLSRNEKAALYQLQDQLPVYFDNQFEIENVEKIFCIRLFRNTINT